MKHRCTLLLGGAWGLALMLALSGSLVAQQAGDTPGGSADNGPAVARPAAGAPQDNAPAERALAPHEPGGFAATRGAGDKVKFLQVTKYPLVEAIQWLAGEFELDIVMSGDVKGQVTMTLQAVSYKTVLQTMLATNGYRLVSLKSIYVVLPKATMLKPNLATKPYLVPRFVDFKAALRDFKILATKHATVVANEASRIILVRDDKSRFEILDEWFLLTTTVEPFLPPAQRPAGAHGR